MLTLEQMLEKHGPLPLYNADGSLSQLEAKQIEDIIRLATWGRAIGDLPVGYGKTAIATAVTLMWQPPLTLILVPPILIDQWVRWLRSIRGVGKVAAYDGSPKQRTAMDLTIYDYLVMSFGVFRKDHERLQKITRGYEIAMVVDEAQNMKNYKSKLFQYVRDIMAGSQRLLLMSGTLMSGIDDAYSYIKLTNSAAYSSFQMFRNIHAKEIDFFGTVKEWHNLDLLTSNLNHRRVHRTKEEVHSGLPKARFIPIFYDLPKEHMKLYRELMTDRLLILEDGSKIDATTAQLLYHKAQQIVTNWGVFADDETKVSRVFELIDEICEEINFGGRIDPDLLATTNAQALQEASKLMLWTQYKMTSRRVHAYLNEKAAKARPGGYAVAAYGEVDSRKEIDKFMFDLNAIGLAAQPGSAGAGLNPQGFCWEMAFIETPTRTIHFEQAAGRIDRKGQRFNPNIRLFVARGTIQEGLLQNLLSNDALVKKASGSAKGIKDLIFPGGI
jgi:hypothetical protein